MEEVHPRDVPPVRLALRCGYLGDRFYGSQMQPGVRTVEGEFVASCLRTGLFSSHREGRFQAAGRTDRGVHARAQVFSFSTPFHERALAALNWQLPADIWITGYAVTEPGFNPRHQAISRTYRYYFGEMGLDTPAMDRAARCFVGTFDFSQFARVEGKDPVRQVLSSRVFQDKDLCVFEVRAGSFLWHMVRYMASALLRIGSGTEGEDLILSRLEGDASTRLSPAPPEGLVLWDVEYDFPFLPITLDRRTRNFLETRWVYHREMTQVLDTLRDSADVRDGHPASRLCGYDDGHRG
ncbi:MAG: tRNA pseudouridine(38-40) synthase TruA [Methanolinea sp.]|nr:tRNA pseudouridine(38-40) synthase TruA [Methanolinea sp.]